MLKQPSNHQTMTVEEHITIGNAAFDRKDFDAAIMHYSAAIALDATNIIAYYNRGLAKNNIGQHRDAIADFNEAIRLEPENAPA